jgi:hypothetical protein
LCKCDLNSPVLTSLKETLFCVLRASFKLGCTKSLSTPPLDEAILVVVVVALVLNPRHGNLLFVFAGSAGKKERNFQSLLTGRGECQESRGQQHTKMKEKKHVFSGVQCRNAQTTTNNGALS